MDRYKRRHAEVLAMRWTERNTQELIGFLVDNGIEHHWEDENGNQGTDCAPENAVWFEIDNNEELDLGDVLLWHPDTRKVEAMTLATFEDEWEVA